MIFRFSAALALAGLAAGLVRAAPALPLQHGESLKYRVSWAVVPGAGEIRIEGRQEEPVEKPRLVVTTTTATRGFARMILRFDAEARSDYDLTTGKLLNLREHSDQRGKIGDYRVDFDYAARTASYVRTAPKAVNETLTLPEGDPSDLILGLLQTRTWDLKPGDKRDALVLYSQDFYELTIHALSEERVTTSLGDFNTILLQPRMEKTPPKGMFKKGSVVRVWISQDRLRLPVKFEVEFKIGTGTATLEAYTAPFATKAPETNLSAAGVHAADPRP